jgi:hypothetical protein
MKLNLPLDLANRNILLAGAGGGWDIFGGLPLLHEWRETCKIVLANFSAVVEGFDVRPAIASDHPEGKLADALGTPIYVFGKAGVRTLKAGYDKLLKQHNIDTIILVDGGVDSLMRGDEEGCGTIFQDTISVGVVDSLNVPTKILACVGFGTETEEGVCHYRALENIAALTKDGRFLGACALTANMEAFQFYEEVCLKVFAQPAPRSHIHTRIIPAVHGEFGQFAMYDDQYSPVDILSDMPPFVSPLAPIFWFFDVAAVAHRSILISAFANTDTFAEVDAIHKEMYPSLKTKMRKNRIIPL